jgi:radial spoke head protein 4/6
LVGDANRISEAIETAGVGMALEETAACLAATRKLAVEKGLEHSRFWGKIFGLEQNYYVAESEHVMDSVFVGCEESKDGVVKDSKGRSIPQEEGGSGANTYTYWVCNFIGQDWIPLPDVTPAQIVVSRKIKKLFSGDLKKKMSTYPPFPGREMEFLRAQIARVTASSTVFVDGYLSLRKGEENEESEEEEAVVGPQVRRVDGFEGVEAALELKELEKWVHARSFLLKMGRVTNPPRRVSAEGDEGEEEEEAEDEAVVEAEKELLSAVGGEDGDEPIQSPSGGEEEDASEAQDAAIPSWIARVCGSTVSDMEVCVVRSLRWPGAFSISAMNGRECTAIYVGDGMKAEGFTPMLPPMVELEKAPMVPTVDPEAMLVGPDAGPEDDDDDDDDDDDEE